MIGPHQAGYVVEERETMAVEKGVRFREAASGVLLDALLNFLG
jgi:hypothetical protein